jgi:cytochrome c oxidase assembly protein subunit 15
LLGGLFLQVLLGLSNIYFSFPVSVAVGHNLFGLVLLLIMVTLSHRVYTAKIAD